MQQLLHCGVVKDGGSPQAFSHFASKEPTKPSLAFHSQFCYSSSDNSIDFHMVELYIPVVPHSEIMSNKNNTKFEVLAEHGCGFTF